MLSHRAAMDAPEAAAQREALGKALARALARITRRIIAVRGDLARAGEADALAQRAQLFVAEAARARRGAARLVATDWSSGEPREVVLEIDPARGAQQQVDAMFQRARRLKEGARISQERLQAAERMHAALETIATELATTEEPDFESLAARARAAAPRDFKAPVSALAGRAQTSGAPAKRKQDQAKPPYRTFLASSGARILVGRNAEKNDELTLHVARPRDLWLHAKNRKGSHVVVPLAKGAVCPPEVLAEAAHLAAHFSEAREEDLVEIQHTPRRYVRKPRKSPPGLVVVDREKVMLLRRRPEVLRGLLEREIEE
jgi:predicted ribosome quality control (RQC) complex YloA/Tae2 family protein